MQKCPDCDDTGEGSYWLIDHVQRAVHHFLDPDDHDRDRDDDHHGDHDHGDHDGDHHRHERAKYLSYTVTLAIPPPHRKKVYLRMADLTVKESDLPATVSVTLLDVHGDPTTPDIPVGLPGGPAWAEDSNGTVVILSPSADGLSAGLSWVAAGTANITFTVSDNDGTKIIGTGQVQVNSGSAVKVALTFTAGVTPPPTPAPTP